MPRAAGEGTFFAEIPPLAAERGAEGQGPDAPGAGAPAAAGQGAAPQSGPQDALFILQRLTDQDTTFETLRGILEEVQPPIPWMHDPTAYRSSPQYREVFVGLDRRIQPAFPGLPMPQVPRSVNREAAKFYVEMHQRGGRKKLSRKHNASRRRTRRGPLRRATRSRRTRSRV